jgi:hypothetical protein
MTAREIILNVTHPLTEMQKNSAGISPTVLADALFENFVLYAKKNWDYSATAPGLKGQLLLETSGRNAPACGTLREALLILLRDELGLEAKPCDINERFISKPDLRCFDSKVKGNLGNLGGPTYDLGCHFSAHYFVECQGKFYDPCFATIYKTKEEPVAHRTKAVTLPDAVLSVPTSYSGNGRTMIILRKVVNKTVPGFGEVWEMLKLDEVKRAFSSADLKLLSRFPALKGLI